MLKIIAINNRFPPDTWLGPETQIFYRLNYLQARGWKTSVITLSKNRGPGKYKFRGITIYSLRNFENRATKKSQNIMTMIRWGIEDLFDPVAFFKCIQIFSKERPGLVWVRCIDQLSLAPLFAAKLMRIPLIITPADFWWLCHISDPLTTCLDLDGHSCATCISAEGYYGEKSSNTKQVMVLNEVLHILHIIKKKVFNSVFDLVIFPSEFLKSQYIRHMVKVPNYTLIYNPGIIDMAKFSSEDIKSNLGLKNEPIILYVGALRFAKAVDLLIVAFDEIKKEIPDAKLIIVGDGPEKSKLILLAQKSEFQNDIVFAGLISDRKKISEYYEISDVVVAPSRYFYPPAYSAVVLEALANGKPVVVTGRDDESVLKDGVNGYKVNFSDKDLAIGVIKVLKDHKTNFSENNKLLYKNFFSYETVFKKYLEVFVNVIENQNKH